MLAAGRSQIARAKVEMITGKAPWGQFETSIAAMIHVATVQAGMCGLRVLGGVGAVGSLLHVSAVIR